MRWTKVDPPRLPRYFTSRPRPALTPRLSVRLRRSRSHLEVTTSPVCDAFEVLLSHKARGQARSPLACLTPMLTSSPHNLTPTPIYPSRLPLFNPHLKPTQSHFPTLHAQAEAAVAKEVEKERKARAEHSRMQRAKAPEHPICAPWESLMTSSNRLTRPAQASPTRTRRLRSPRPHQRQHTSHRSPCSLHSCPAAAMDKGAAPWIKAIAWW